MTTLWLVTLTFPAGTVGVLDAIQDTALTVHASSMSVLPADGRALVRFHNEADASVFRAIVAPTLPELWAISDPALEPPLVLPEDERGAFRRTEPEVMDVQLVGGPLDGMVLPRQEIDEDPGAYMIVPGWIARAAYGPLPDGDRAVWHHQGDVA